MKRLSLLLFALTLADCHPAASPAVAPPTTNISASTPASRTTASEPPVDHLGDSTTTAVTIPKEAPAGGAVFENEWIFDHYGKFRRKLTATGSQEGRRYDVVKIELFIGGEATIYFDITDNWNNWTPPPVPAP
jgi:hypothetical protein